MASESEIIYENGDFWVYVDRKRSAYVVFRSGITHSTSDGTYQLSADGLTLAKARVDYLAKAHGKYDHALDNG